MLRSALPPTNSHTALPPPGALGLAELFVFAQQGNKLYYLMKNDPGATAEANTPTVCL